MVDQYRRRALLLLVSSHDLTVADLDFMRQLVEIVEGKISDLTPDEKHAASNGYRIPAIKSYRDRTGRGLKEAKDIVEKWMADNGVVAQPSQY